MDSNYFQINRIIDTSKFTFLKGLSTTESRLVKKMFLQLKVDIFSGGNQRLEPAVKKKIKKDLEKQLFYTEALSKNFYKSTHFLAVNRTQMSGRAGRTK